MTEYVIRRAAYQRRTAGVAGAISVALAVGLTLGVSAAVSTPQSKPSPSAEEASLCLGLANATPQSPGAFRLSEEVADLRVSC